MLTAAGEAPADSQALSGILLCGTNVVSKGGCTGNVVQAGAVSASPGLRA